MTVSGELHRGSLLPDLVKTFIFWSRISTEYVVMLTNMKVMNFVYVHLLVFMQEVELLS